MPGPSDFPGSVSFEEAIACSACLAKERSIVLRMTIVKAASEQNVYSQIFRPITTARLQVVAEKSGMYSWNDNELIDFL